MGRSPRSDSDLKFSVWGRRSWELRGIRGPENVTRPNLALPMLFTYGVAAHPDRGGMVTSTAVLRWRTKLSPHRLSPRETRKGDRSLAAHTPLCRGELRKRAPTGSHGAPPGPRSCGGTQRAFHIVRNRFIDMVVNEPWRDLGSRPCRSHVDGCVRLTGSRDEHRRQRRWGCAVLTGTCPYIDIQR